MSLHREWILTVGMMASMWAGPVDLRAQGGYPLVYGPTGTPYGPTQAHYQYQRQYGQPWPGDGVNPPAAPPNPNGVPIIAQPFRGHRGGGYGMVHPQRYFTPWGDPYAPYGYGYPPPPGWGYWGWSPGFVGQGWFVGQGAMGGMPQQNPFGISPVPDPNAQLNAAAQQTQNFWKKYQAQSTTPQQQQAAAKFIAQGDQQLQERRYREAATLYQRAIQEASDLPEPHYKLALAWGMLRNYPAAASELKHAAGLDPSLPRAAPALSAVYGEGESQRIDLMLQSVAQWAREDIRDPDRLFLVGALLYLNGDSERAAIPLKSAANLTRGGAHVVTFLDATTQQIQQAGNRSNASEQTDPAEEQPHLNPAPLPVPRRLPAADPKPTAPVPTPQKQKVNPPPKSEEPPADPAPVTEETPPSAGPAFPSSSP